MREYDSPWKEALCRLFQPFLELVRPEVHAGIDWSRGYQSLGDELRKIVRESRNPGRRVDCASRYGPRAREKRRS